MHHDQQDPAKGKVVSLDAYREVRKSVTPRIEIQLLPGGKFAYSSVDLDESDTFQALIGCYVVAGKLLQSLRDRMQNGTDSTFGSPD